jgi:hypothetical protein
LFLSTSDGMCEEGGVMAELQRSGGKKVVCLLE